MLMRMDDAALYQQVGQIFLGVFRRRVELRPETSANDVPGWDSFNHVKLILAVEDHFGIQLHIEDINALKTVGDLVRLVARKTGHDDPAPPR
jgi:acyl carrier protein